MRYMGASWGEPGAKFWCFFFEIITFCALVGPIFIFSSKSSSFGPWLGRQVPENNHRDHRRAQRIVFCIEFCKFGTQFWVVRNHRMAERIVFCNEFCRFGTLRMISRIRDGGRRSDLG